jgi:hypothetical protein
MLRMYVQIQSYIPSGHHTEHFCEVEGYHSSAFVYLHLPWYEAVSLGERLPTSRKYSIIFPKRHKQITEWHDIMPQKMPIISEHILHNFSFLQQNKCTKFSSTDSPINIGLP